MSVERRFSLWYTPGLQDEKTPPPRPNGGKKIFSERWNPAKRVSFTQCPQDKNEPGKIASNAPTGTPSRPRLIPSISSQNFPRLPGTMKRRDITIVISAAVMLTGFVTVTIMLHNSLRADMRDLRTEVREDIEDLRTDVREDIEDLRTEIAGLRTEVREDIEGLRTEIAGLRTETREDIQDLRDDIQNLRNDIQVLLAAKAIPTDAATGKAAAPASSPAPPDSALAPHAGPEPGVLSALDEE